jgi:type VI secretion system secreted protein VgrG
MSVNDPWQFSSSPLSAADCRVLAFTGEEAIEEGYLFDILLAASKVGPGQAEDMQEALMNAPLITLTGRGKSGDTFSWSGIPGEVAYAFPSEAGAIYRVVLRPRSWRLRASVHSRIFLKLSLPGIIENVLAEEHMAAGTDFADEMKGSYNIRPYTCQYNESSFTFLSRRLERVGAYTYIRQTENGDVLVFADDKTTPEKLAPGDNLDLSEEKTREAVFAFTRIFSAGPRKVVLRDYSSEKPGLTEGKAEDAGNGPWRKGERVHYGGFDLFGEHDCFTKKFSPEEAHERADALAATHLASLACHACLVEGQSTVPRLRAGYVFSLGGEPHRLVRVRHRFFMTRDEMESRIAKRARWVGFRFFMHGDDRETRILKRARLAGLIAENEEPGYKNDFVCSPLKSGPYISARRTPMPVIAGVIHAVIDASGSGEYAELDDEGRYKVKFPFAEKVFHADSNNPGDGNNSVPLRMMQMHAGEQSGIHFPLLKGTEVLTAFVKGNPDRPVILGTLPNASIASPVIDKSRQTNVISTPGGNSITFVDTRGQQKICLESADKSSSITLFRVAP